MDPWATIGMVGAAYDLGLVNRVIGRQTTRSAEFSPRTALLSGLAGYGIGTLQLDRTEQRAARAQNDAARLQQVVRAQGATIEQLRRENAELAHTKKVLDAARAAILSARGG